MTITTDRSVTTTIDVPEGVTAGHGSVELTAAADWQGLLLGPTDGDRDGFSLTVMRYPAGGSISSIRLATEDAGEPGPAGFLQGQAAGRACSQGCRIPPGTYDLMAVVRGGGPLTASWTLDGLEGERTLNGSELDGLSTSVAAFGGGIPSRGEAVDSTLRNTGTRRVAVESVKIQQLAGTGGLLGGAGAGWVDVGHLCDEPGCTTVLDGPIEPNGDVKVQTDTSRLALGDHRVVWTFIDDSPAARELPAEQRERYVEYGTFFVYL